MPRHAPVNPDVVQEPTPPEPHVEQAILGEEQLPERQRHEDVANETRHHPPAVAEELVVLGDLEPRVEDRELLERFAQHLVVERPGAVVLLHRQDRRDDDEAGGGPVIHLAGRGELGPVARGIRVELSPSVAEKPPDGPRDRREDRQGEQHLERRVREQRIDTADFRDLPDREIEGQRAEGGGERREQFSGPARCGSRVPAARAPSRDRARP